MACGHQRLGHAAPPFAFRGSAPACGTAPAHTRQPPRPPLPQVYVIDGFDTAPEVVEALKARGRAAGAPVYPVCYISAGTREDWRPDAAAFTEKDLGDPLPNWPGERWLDVSSANVRAVMRERLKMCRDKVRARTGTRVRGQARAQNPQTPGRGTQPQTRPRL